MAEGIGTLSVFTVEADVEYNAGDPTAAVPVEVTAVAAPVITFEAASFVIGDSGNGILSVFTVEAEVEYSGGLVIVDPGSFAIQTASEADFNTMEANTEGSHAMPKLATIDPAAETYTTSGNWPDGTWEQGHFDDSTSWYQELHPSLNYFGAHVRVRRSAEFGRGYIWSIVVGYDYGGRAQTRIKNAVDYLTSVQIASDPFDASRDGSWIGWTWRKSYDELILNEDYWATTTASDNRVDLNWFSVGRCLAFISMAYVQAVQNGLTVAGDTDYTTAIDNGVTNLFSEIGDVGTFPSPNVNFHAAALWGLCHAEKAGRPVGVVPIGLWVDAILSTQDTNEASDHYGAFYDASDVDIDGDPSQDFYHDCKVNYLAIDLRALAEALMVLPDGTRKDNVREAIKLLINHLINTRIAPDNTLYTNYKTTGGVDPNVSNSGTQTLELMLVAVCRTLVASEFEGGFTSTEQQRLLDFASRLAEPMFLSRYGFAGWGCYRATVDWWQAGATGTDILLEMP